MERHYLALLLAANIAAAITMSGCNQVGGVAPLTSQRPLRIRWAGIKPGMGCEYQWE